MGVLQTMPSSNQLQRATKLLHTVASMLISKMDEPSRKSEIYGSRYAPNYYMQSIAGRAPLQSIYGHMRYAMLQMSTISFLPLHHFCVLSPQQRGYSGVKVDANLNIFHAFGCRHWAPRARLRTNLGFSTRHARTVYNILNINTATVSPQFHVKHDDFFESIIRLFELLIYYYLFLLPS